MMTPSLLPGDEDLPRQEQLLKELVAAERALLEVTTARTQATQVLVDTDGALTRAKARVAKAWGALRGYVDTQAESPV